MKLHEIQIKRIYDEPAKGDGFRILVDRLWPRGVSKASAHVDLWMKDIAPSSELRIWYGHDPEKWSEFQKRYRHELLSKKELKDFILDKCKSKTVTLLYAAKDVEHSHALALKKVLESD